MLSLSLLFSLLLFLLCTQQIVCEFFDDFSDQVAFQKNWQISTNSTKFDKRYNVTWSDLNAKVSARDLFLFVSTNTSVYYGGEISTKQRYNQANYEVSAKFTISPGTSNTIIGLTNDGVINVLQLSVASLSLKLEIDDEISIVAELPLNGDYENQFHIFSLTTSNSEIQAFVDNNRLINFKQTGLDLSNKTLHIQSYVCNQNNLNCGPLISLPGQPTRGLNIQWVKITNSTEFTVEPSSIPSDPTVLQPSLDPTGLPSLSPTFPIDLLDKVIIGADISIIGNFSFQNITLQFNTSGVLTIQGCVDVTGGNLLLHVRETDFNDGQLSISPVRADCFIGDPFFSVVEVNGLESCRDFDEEQEFRTNLLVVLISIRNICHGLSDSEIIIIVVCCVVVPLLAVAVILLLKYQKQIWKKN